MIKNNERLDYIAWIQFVGIILVVFGHSMNGLAVSSTIIKLQTWVYTFHMPLFFLVSAYLFAYNGGFEHKGGYWGTLKGKFSRLVLPYLIWNAAFVLPKIIFSNYITDEVELSVPYFLKLAVYPRENILGHTWFLFTLFEFFVLAIFLERFRKKRQLQLPVLAVLMVLNCFGIKERFLSIGDLMQNAVFFWIGLLLGSYKKEDILNWGKDSILMVSLLMVVIAGIVVWSFYPDMLINTLVFGIAIIFFIGMIQIRYGITNKLIDFISKNTFAIYILHWPVMMIVRLVFYQKLNFSSGLTMAMMFVGGLVISMSIAWLFRQLKSPLIKSFSKVVLGM